MMWIWKKMVTKTMESRKTESQGTEQRSKVVSDA